ncbi:LytR C-terminal domain-containing protein [Gordonia polyisoprenivorans]|uniref:LytR C-terminal domain-containing protein n=1 Tax=Gordonia polyisoprenivorans TaxID=84595 RepID=UPI001AD696C0|nr:LytR C-terminal domain-containing protein [Gordonia polyisoprenivorans]QTI70243.1 LytR C-terminal domain-containing protein [Gordonia polyisoprenivorans]
MNADRESNRLPLRAGAMVLFAVAIVFVALGWHHAATSGDNPEAQLQAAQSSVPSTTSAPASTTSSSATGNARICVINAGTVTGLATEVDEELKGKGFTTIGINAQSNYDGGFSQNTVVYSSPAQKDQADKIAQALDNDYTVDSRANLGSSFSRCVGGIAVVAVQR